MSRGASLKMYNIFCAVMYVVKSGCQWRYDVRARLPGRTNYCIIDSQSVKNTDTGEKFAKPPDDCFGLFRDCCSEDSKQALIRTSW
jgi:hypothetical protein